MAEVLVILADGFEETEALVPVDLLRRAGASVTLAALDENRKRPEGCEKTITGAHGICVICDTTLDCAAEGVYDAVVLPGGMPGAANLAASKVVTGVIMKAHEAGKLICAICASPAVVLGPLGLVNGRKAVCYPGYEKDFPEGTFGSQPVVRDGSLITARGAGCAYDFGLEIVSALFSREKADRIALSTVYC